MKTISKLEDIFMKGVTGYVEESINNQAINEDQIAMIFDQSEQSLQRFQKNIEIAESWMLQTICKLRYGSSYQGNSISYGNYHFIFSYEILLNVYQKSIKANADPILLDVLLDQVYATKYRDNPDQLKRVKIETHLDPLKHINDRSVIMDMVDKFLLSREDAMMKLNLPSYKQRFERENVDLLTFGEDMLFSDKINLIKETMMGYIKLPESVSNALTD